MFNNLFSGRFDTELHTHAVVQKQTSHKLQIPMHKNSEVLQKSRAEAINRKDVLSKITELAGDGVVSRSVPFRNNEVSDFLGRITKFEQESEKSKSVVDG